MFWYRNSVRPRKAGWKFNNRELIVEGRVCRVAHLDADDYKFLDDPDRVVEELSKSKVNIDLFTFLQQLPGSTPKYSYPFEWDNMAVLFVSTFEHWWTQQIGFKARNKAKQAEKKGIVVREVPFDDAFAKGIWKIYNECPVRQGRIFPHFGKSLQAVHDMSVTYFDTSIFVGAFDGDRLVGFVKLTVDDAGAQAGLMHILSLLEYRDKAPTNALMAQAVRSCAERHIPHLVYSKFAYAKKQISGLSEFKERNGFKKVDIPRYYVPLTRWGSVALSMGLHHRFVDRLPESVASKLRDFRMSWYQRKFRLQPESL
jgi:hypothetical protein